MDNRMALKDHYGFEYVQVQFLSHMALKFGEVT